MGEEEPAQGAQRRRNFRILAPPGTQLLPEQYPPLDVIDISLGGILCARVRVSIEPPPSCLEMGLELVGMNLAFPGDGQSKRVSIEKGCIIREDRETDPSCCRYGIAFTHIAPEERRRLLQQIYHYQRLFLQQRLNINL